MSWIQISLHTTRELAELLSNALSNGGALSVTLQDAKDQPLLEPGVGETPIWDQVIVTGLFESSTNPQGIIKYIQQQLPESALLKYEVSQLEEKVWEREWMKEFHPMQFGQRTWICPSWLAPPDPAAVNILLDPGLAFGTGTHPTTALCLQWLDVNIHGGERVVDYGCGSGILAIAAAMLGASKVWAIDNDPQALIATKSNAENNAVQELIECLDVKQPIDIKADVLIANILANPLISLANTFKGLLRPGAPVILSGILTEQQDSVIEAYSHDFVLENCATQEDWSRLDFKRL